MASDLTVGLDMIAAATVPTKPAARLLWGVVTSTASPVQVVLENDASGTSRPVSGNAAGPVAVGDRVLLARQRRRLTIISNPTATSRLPRAVAVGTITTDTLAGGDIKQYTATFPTGRFTAPPVVTAILQSGSDVVRVIHLSLVSRSATSVTFRVAHTGASGTVTPTIVWHAAQA